MTVVEVRVQPGQGGCIARAREHVRQELWSFLALSGLFFLYLGIIVVVYALKGVFARDVNDFMTFFGVFLTTAGAVNLMVSGMAYRYHRHKRQFHCFGLVAEEEDVTPKPPPSPKERPRVHNLAGFLTPEFAKYAEFSARDRRYDKKKYTVFKLYDPTQVSISFAHRYWREQQKQLLQTSLPGSQAAWTLLPKAASPQGSQQPTNSFRTENYKRGSQVIK